MRIKKSKLNRETYLEKAKDIISKSLFKPKGYKVPKVVLSCSWSTKGNRSSKLNGDSSVLGQCFRKANSESGINHITITPNMDGTTLKGTQKVLMVLVHELVHAVDDCESGHGEAFKRCAISVGLTGKMTATIATDWLNDYFKNSVISKLGLFPHHKLTAGGRPDNVRNLKVSCDCCGFSFRTSKMNINRLPSYVECPTGCGGEMDNEPIL